MKGFFLTLLLVGVTLSIGSDSGRPESVDACARYTEDFIERKITIVDDKIDAKANEVRVENDLLSKRIDTASANLDSISHKLEKKSTLRKLRRELRKEATLTDSE